LMDGMKAQGGGESLFKDGQQDVNTHRNPDLGFHGRDGVA
jgi:hypothetical protein